MKKFDYNGRKNICGNRVRCLRTARRWSQAALAAKMQTQGVIMEQDVVSKIESGDRLVTDYEVRAFAAVFGVAFENLIETKNERPSGPEPEGRFFLLDNILPVVYNKHQKEGDSQCQRRRQPQTNAIT